MGSETSSWNKLVNKLEQIPDDKKYTSSPVTPAIGMKVMEAVSRLSWPASGRCSIGWQAADQPIAPETDPELWRKITSLAAKMLDAYLKLNPQWTYSRITAARGLQMKDLPIQGGVGGSVFWAWSKVGGVAAKVGYCRKFNAHNRLVKFHSRTAANLFPGCEDSYALLFHNFDNGPFEVAEHRRGLKSWGLAPDPITDKSDSEESSTTTEAEEEESPHHAWVSFALPPPQTFTLLHGTKHASTQTTHPPWASPVLRAHVAHVGSNAGLTTDHNVEEMGGGRKPAGERRWLVGPGGTHQGASRLQNP